MLRRLIINHLAVIDKLDIDFSSGMTVLTGETGAGKSILLDALGLILGNRADINLIRANAEKTDISAFFSLSNNPAILDKLLTLELISNDDIEDEFFVRRTISSDGRSRAYINNTPVAIQTLKELGEYLIDIHGQHAHQSLSRLKTQRQLLDQFGQYQSVLDELQQTYHQWKQINQQLDDFRSVDESFDAKLNLLRYQIEELEALNVDEPEYQALLEQHKRLTHSQRLLDTCNVLVSALSESENAIINRLVNCQKETSELCQFDNQLENINQLLDSATIQIEEASHEMKHYVNQIEVDDAQLTAIESRLQKLHDLARKHKLKPGELSQYLATLKKQLSQLEGSKDQYELLEKKKTELTQDYFKQATCLTSERCSVAEKISRAVTDKMHELAISGEFKVALEGLGDDEPHQYGMDKITFLVSTNPGQPLRPITKVASGGELSRLSLAIQIIGVGDSGIPTMIFDEVDAGISGGVAETVGQLLRRLAAHRQILCVTHLAQVASCGHHHLRVDKTSKENATFTQIESLNQNERIREVARLLAGMEITDESLANAASMLNLD